MPDTAQRSSTNTTICSSDASVLFGLPIGLRLLHRFKVVVPAANIAFLPIVWVFGPSNSPLRIVGVNLLQTIPEADSLLLSRLHVSPLGFSLGMKLSKLVIAVCAGDCLHAVGIQQPRG